MTLEEILVSALKRRLAHDKTLVEMLEEWRKLSKKPLSNWDVMRKLARRIGGRVADVYCDAVMRKGQSLHSAHDLRASKEQ